MLFVTLQILQMFLLCHFKMTEPEMERRHTFLGSHPEDGTARTWCCLNPESSTTVNSIVSLERNIWNSISGYTYL